MLVPYIGEVGAIVVAFVMLFVVAPASLYAFVWWLRRPYRDLAGEIRKRPIAVYEFERTDALAVSLSLDAPTVESRNDVDIAEESPCYRPKGHEGACGEPVSDDEEDDRILFGRCGAKPPQGLMYA